jgi:hypothetical protein
MTGNLVKAMNRKKKKIDLSALLEVERGLLIRSLDNDFKTIPLADLGNWVANTEQWIEHYFHKILWNLSPFVFHCEKCAKQWNIYDRRGNIYEVLLGKDIQEPLVMSVTIVPKLQPQTPKLRRKTFRITGFGHYSKVRVFWPSNYSFFEADYFNEIVHSILGTGSLWITQKIEAISAQNESYLAANLYSLLRTIVSSEELRANLWIATVTETYGFRLIDQKVTTNAFQIYYRNSHLHGFSANRLCAELISTRLPCEGLLMNVARSLNQCIDGNIRDANYRKEGSIYAAAMFGLYGREEFTIYPFYIDSQFGVFALFPTEARQKLAPLLNQNKDHLANTIKEGLGEIKNYEKAFEKKSPKRFSLARVIDCFNLKPNLFGIGLDINSLIKTLLRDKKENRKLLKVNIDLSEQ